MILQTRRDVLNLSTIAELPRLVSALGDDQLANFCRICAVTISDLDMYESKSSLFQQNQQKRSKAFVPLRDINQDALLAIGDLLPRLVTLSVKKPYIPRFPDLATELGENEMERNSPIMGPILFNLYDPFGGLLMSGLFFHFPQSGYQLPIPGSFNKHYTCRVS